MNHPSPALSRDTPLDDLKRLVRTHCSAVTLGECEALANKVVELLEVGGSLRPEGRIQILKRILADVTGEQRKIALNMLEETSLDQAAKSPAFQVAAAGELLWITDEAAFSEVHSIRSVQLQTTWRDLRTQRDNKKFSAAYQRAALWIGLKSARSVAPDRKQPKLLEALLTAICSYLTEEADSPAANEQRKKNREALRRLVSKNLETLSADTEPSPKKQQDAVEKIQIPRNGIGGRVAPPASPRAWASIRRHWLGSLATVVVVGLALTVMVARPFFDQDDSSDNSSSKATSRAGSLPASIPMAVDTSFAGGIHFSPLGLGPGDSVDVHTGQEISFGASFSAQPSSREAVLPLAVLPPDGLTNLKGYVFTANVELQLPPNHPCKGDLVKWSIPNGPSDTFGHQEGILGPEVPPVDVVVNPGPDGQIQRLTVRTEALDSCSPMTVIVHGPRLVRV
jgi:hypothetical protein